MNLVTNRARAYVYAGEWVADCPGKCGNVEFLFDLSVPQNPTSPRTVRKAGYYCSYCHHVAEIEWSPNEAEIMDALDRRPIPHTRNWYPAGHDVALQYCLPHGQSVEDLIAEGVENGVI